MAHLSHVSRRQLLAGATASGLAGIGTPALAKAPMANTQAPSFYRFKLGAFELTVVSDGPLQMGAPQPNIFTDTSKDEMVKTLADNFLPSDAVAMEQNALVVNTGNQLVLIDTGLGAFKMMGNDTGRLVANLKAAGISPGDVDAVLLTHAHGDHCFGLLRADGAREFPNAQVFVTQSDYNFWTDEAKVSHPQIGEFVAATRKHLMPNRDRIAFIVDGQEVVPGIHAIATPGHTVGHVVFMITSQGQTICNAGDIAHHHIISVETPRKEFAYDTDGKLGVASRLRLFDMLSAKRMPLIAYHFPWPGIGYIGKHGDAYRYFPSPMRTVL
ncbi:MAG: MBL fold metallo-hydrolase [Xanthobacteraceae bacterium]|nr:MBL fold metallo-hydrolase [Xanthobacteraceae bacterium]